jgi:hypothetical protein
MNNTMKVNDNKANDFTLYFKEKMKKERKDARNRIKGYKRNQKLMQSMPSNINTLLKESMLE